MNISTYEARIAALEAQLRPGSANGILSMTITPDIVNDGTSLKDRLQTMMPITDEREIIWNLQSALPESEYTVKITPSNGSYAALVINREWHYGTAMGEELTASVPTDADGNLEFDAVSISNIPSGDDRPDDVYGLLTVSISLGA